MAGRAVDLCPYVRRVVEPYVRLISPAIDSLPGNVFAPVVVGADFPDLWMVRQGLFVAVPTGPNIRESGSRPPTRGKMAVHAFQLSVFGVRFVDEGNRLGHFGAHAKEMPHGLAY